MLFFSLKSVRFCDFVRLRSMNDTERFKTEWLPLQPAMQRMAETLLGNEEDAADVVQDCFVSLWTDREKLRNVVNCEAWAITMVKRKSFDLMRKRHTTVEIDERMEIADELQEDDDRLQLAYKLIDRLPERQALAVMLRHYSDVDTQGIAATMNISEGNVYVLLSRAYQSLKKMILEYEQN